MKRARSSEEPTRASLREMPEVDFAAYRVRKNPFAKRIAREGVHVVAQRPAGRGPVREREPSRASLREMPEVDPAKGRARPNPYAKRIAVEGITLPIGRGRPKRGAETGPTVPKSIRLPEQVWARLAERAQAEGIPLHAALRAAVLEWLDHAA
jgi:Ribbon-helix-helix protein, copG family